MTTTPITQVTEKPFGVIRWSWTWVEVGLWGIFVLGAFQGTFKRYLPISDSLITLTYDGLCFGLLGFVLLRRTAKSWQIPYSPLTPPILIFCGFTFLTIFNSQLTSLMQGLLGWRFLASSVLLHFLGFYAFEELGQVQRLLKTFWITAGVVATYGVVQLIRGYTVIEFTWIAHLAATMKIAGTNRYRLMSTMGSAVDLGFFITLAIVTLFGVLLLSKPRKLIHFILLGLMLFVLLYTFVRTAWIATFVGVAYLCIFRLWNMRSLRPLFPVFIAGLSISLILSVIVAGQLVSHSENLALQERVRSLQNPLEDFSVQARFKHWETTWQVIQQYPLGLGVGMTGAARLKYAHESAVVSATVDNSYLKVLVETGWIGLVLFLWLMAAVLRGGLSIVRKLQGEYQLLASLFVACFISFTLLLFFGEYIELNPARSFIWIFSGFLFCLPRLSQTQK